MQQASAKRKQEFEEESAKRKQEFKRIEEESSKRMQEIEQRQAERQKEYEQHQQALAKQREEESARRQQEAARRQQEIERLQALAHQQRLRVLHNAVTSILQNPNSAHQVLQQQAATHGLSATLGCVKNAIVAHNAHQQQVKWRQYSEKQARSQARRDVTTNKKRKLREDEKAGMMLPESVFEDEEDRLAFEGIPNHFYQNQILPLKRGTSTEFFYAVVPLVFSKAARAGSGKPSLDLDADYFTDIGRKRIGQLIAAENKSLKTLKITATDDNSISKIFKVAGGHPSIEKIVISPQCKGSTAMSGAFHLFNSIRMTPLLRSLEISGQVDISNHGLGLLGSALEGKPLEYLNYTRAKDSSATYQSIKPLLERLYATVLNHLHLGEITVGVDSCKGIAGLLAHPKSALTTVCVDSIEDDDSVQVLCASLSHNTTFQTFHTKIDHSSNEDTLSKESRNMIKKLVFGGSSIDSVCNANHTLREFAASWRREERYPINNQHVDGTLDWPNPNDAKSIVNDTPQDLAMRRRKKVVKFLTLGGEFNMEPFHNVEDVELMPYALAFVGKRCNYGKPDFRYGQKKEDYIELKQFDDIPLDGMYKVLRYWQMPVLFERA